MSNIACDLCKLHLYFTINIFLQEVHVFFMNLIFSKKCFIFQKLFNNFAHSNAESTISFKHNITICKSIFR